MNRPYDKAVRLSRIRGRGKPLPYGVCVYFNPSPSGDTSLFHFSPFTFHFTVTASPQERKYSTLSRTGFPVMRSSAAA